MAKQIAKSLDEIMANINVKIKSLVEEYKDQKHTEESSKLFFEKWTNIFYDEVGITHKKLASKLCSNVKEKAEELASKIQYIAEYNKFDDGFYHEELPQKTAALKKVATIPENWRIYNYEKDDEFNCINITYGCSAVNNGKDLTGNVLISNKGKVLHHFTNMNDF